MAPGVVGLDKVDCKVAFSRAPFGCAFVLVCQGFDAQSKALLLLCALHCHANALHVRQLACACACCDACILVWLEQRQTNL